MVSQRWKSFLEKIQIQDPELDFLIEIHYESFLDYVFYCKIRIPDFKIKIKIQIRWS